jgi:hypothetical protein
MSPAHTERTRITSKPFDREDFLITCRMVTYLILPKAVPIWGVRGIAIGKSSSQRNL